MATTSVTSTAAQDIYASLARTSETKTSAVDDQQSRFLKLLTTQLKNQDPLNPVDNAQTTSQLAQISTVDGIERLNATLGKLVSSMQSSDAMQAASLVGHSVLVPGSNLRLSSGIAAGGVQLAEGVDKLSVSILDKNGIEVGKIELGKQDAGTHEFVWDGSTLNGTKAVDGTYTLKISASMGDKKVTSEALELATVQGVVTGGKEIQVDVGSLGRVAMGDIKLIL